MEPYNLNTEVGVIGYGFVGEALVESFRSKGKEVLLYDKYKNLGTISEIMQTSITFLCLPTPFIDGYGFNLSAIKETLQYLSSERYEGLVVIKSTTEPGVTRRLSESYNLNIVHNPEFLTARTAFKDFDEQAHIVIGRCSELRTSNDWCYMRLLSLYQQLYPNASISQCSSEESESMKLFCNSFYAVKVQMFNEFFLSCQRTGANFETVKGMMIENGWINEMHTMVPGPDGELSYGGACFGKDTNALNQFMKRTGTPNGVLKATIKERNKMRKD